VVAGWPVTGQNILLAEKAEGNDRGFLMAFGGKINDGETAVEAMIRELREESGYSEVCGTGIVAEPVDLEFVGIIHQYSFLNREQFEKGRPYSKVEITLFFIHTTGTPVDTEEMRNGRWYLRIPKKLPFCRMTEWDRVILPVILCGHTIVARVIRQLEPRKLLGCEIVSQVKRFSWR
jgi:8-oxo-dGTP diphosphatase